MSPTINTGRRSGRPQTKLGDRIRSFRESASLTQKQLAESCGLDPQTIHRYEAGLIEPTASILQALGNALGQAPIEMMSLSGLLLLPERTEKQLATLERRGFRIRKNWRASMPDHFFIRIQFADDAGNLVNVSGEGATSSAAIDAAMLRALRRVKDRDYSLSAQPKQERRKRLPK